MENGLENNNSPPGCYISDLHLLLVFPTEPAPGEGQEEAEPQEGRQDEGHQEDGEELHVLGGDFEGEVLTLGVVDVAEEAEEGDVLQHEEEDPVAPEEAGPVEDDVQAKVGDQSHQLQADTDD